jgi:molybdate transport system ATP-binding protein
MKNIITLQNVTVRLGSRFLLPHTNWEIKSGENWAILGPNGAGKSTLVRALTGDLPCVRGTLTYHSPLTDQGSIGYVSWEEQERLIAREEARDASRYFSRKPDSYETARMTILSSIREGMDEHPDLKKVADMTDVGNLLDRPIRFLSTGEMRKVLMARALLKSPQLLILDEPFCGIDAQARVSLIDIIQALAVKGLPFILITHRLEDLLPTISHIMLLKDGEVIRQGTRDEVLKPEVLSGLYDGKETDALSLIDREYHAINEPGGGDADYLIDMKNVTVRYGETVILDRLNWSVKRGENWAVAGPNGSGKTTLLSLITGDHLQAYANDIRLFGKSKGSGESVWEIKEKVGVVSSEMQLRYRKGIKVEDVVASGLFDSIGLYRRLTEKQQQEVQRCIHTLGLSAMSGRLYSRLSYGERRMALLARAMVKSPQLLVLDEPCQGLDRNNRRFILGMINDIGSTTPTQLLYVTHYPDELPACVRHVLNLARPEQNP